MTGVYSRTCHHATDTPRGLDVKDLPMVINYDLPEDYENYVHRIGRTARAGTSGKALSLACERFVYSLEAIEKYIKMKIPVLDYDYENLPEDQTPENFRMYSNRNRQSGTGGRSPGRRGGGRPQGRPQGGQRPGQRSGRPGGRRDESRPAGSAQNRNRSQHPQDRRPGSGANRQDSPARKHQGGQAPANRDNHKRICISKSRSHGRRN